MVRSQNEPHPSRLEVSKALPGLILGNRRGIKLNLIVILIEPKEN